jgi:hypothetical protein
MAKRFQIENYLCFLTLRFELTTFAYTLSVIPARYSTSYVNMYTIVHNQGYSSRQAVSTL